MKTKLGAFVKHPAFGLQVAQGTSIPRVKGIWERRPDRLGENRDV